MLLKQMYDQAALDRFADSANKAKFTDAAGVLLPRHLTAIDPDFVKVKYPDNVFLNSGVPTSNVGGYANTIQSLRKRGKGSFKDSTDDSNNQGRISLEGEASDIKVIQRGTRALWGHTEVEQAKIGGTSIVSDYMVEVDRIYKQELDTAGLVGIGQGQVGLLNNTDFFTDTFSTAIDAGTALAGLNIVKAFIKAQHDDVHEVPEYMGDLLFMPITTLSWLRTTMFDPDNSFATVLDGLQKMFPMVKFLSTPKAQDVGGKKTMVLVSSNPETFKFRLPVPLKSSPLYQQGFDFSTDYLYRIGGVDILEAKGGRIGESI